MVGFLVGLAVAAAIWAVARFSRSPGRPTLHHTLPAAMGQDLAPVTARYAEKHPDRVALLPQIERDFRRFFAIAAASRRPVGIRSEAVDDYWHELILFTRRYEPFCHAVAGRFLHHEPTGGSELRYARTCAAYATLFGAPPDPALWPAPDAQACAFFLARGEEARRSHEALRAAGGPTLRPEAREAERRREAEDERVLGVTLAALVAAAALLAVLHPDEMSAADGGGGGCSGGDGDGSGCGGGGDGGGCGGGGD